jgi:phytoene synthase
MTPQQYCQKKVLRNGSSLYYSLRFLPSKQRKALTALEAFYAEINEIRYKCQDKQVARLKLQWWQNEIAQTFAGTAHHPVCQALNQAANYDNQLAEHYFQEIIEGFLLDLDVTNYATFEELEEHCKHTYSVLSLLSTHILGYQNESSLKYAEQLGIALQLTDILRELRRDLLKGRLYIPQEDLKLFKVSTQSLFAGQLSETVIALLAYQTTRIRSYYNTAFKYLKTEDCFNQRSGLIRANLALATLQEIEQDGFQLFKHRIRLMPLRKLWIASCTAWKVKK